MNQRTEHWTDFQQQKTLENRPPPPPQKKYTPYNLQSELQTARIGT
jgi:hypothetical protein